MEEPKARPRWGQVLGFALGTGICFVATLGVWLQYSTSTFNAITAGAVSLVVGMLVGGAWALWRPGASG